MKSKFKIRTIEDIALQFIKHNEPKRESCIGSNKTLIDKFGVKKYIKNKNPESSLSQSYERLIPIDNKENVPLNENNNKIKIIKFYKVPQKILGDEEECLFHTDLGNESMSEVTSQKTLKIISNGEVKLREIKQIKYNKKLYFNLNYQNIYDSITQIYFPLLQNLETISSLKAMTKNTLNCIENFCTHDSIFDLVSMKNNTKQNGSNNNINNNFSMAEFMHELKIFENIEFSLVIFIMHIILEARIEYMDSFNEDNILIIYHDCYSVIQKIYEIIILIILFNENCNNPNKKNDEESSNDTKKNKNSNTITFESLCLKYVKDYYKFIQKPSNNEQIINSL